MNEGGDWKMWYGSHLDWGADPHALEFEHVLKYATSTDGIRWTRGDVTCLEPVHPGILAVAKPSVLKDDSGYNLWYGYRGEQYRIGYAFSEDGMRWTQDEDGAGIEPSAGEWDSEAVAYPHVVEHQGARFMFYNGNGYGATGVKSRFVCKSGGSSSPSARLLGRPPVSGGVRGRGNAGRPRRVWS